MHNMYVDIHDIYTLIWMFFHITTTTAQENELLSLPGPRQCHRTPVQQGLSQIQSFSSRIAR